MLQELPRHILMGKICIGPVNNDKFLVVDLQMHAHFAYVQDSHTDTV